MDAAMEFLRKKGLAQADKKASRSASEGIVETYVHTGEWTPSNQLAHPSAGGDAQHGASSCRLEARRDGRGQLRDGLRREAVRLPGALAHCAHATPRRPRDLAVVFAHAHCVHSATARRSWRRPLRCRLPPAQRYASAPTLSNTACPALSARRTPLSPLCDQVEVVDASAISEEWIEKEKKVRPSRQTEPPPRQCRPLRIYSRPHSLSSEPPVRAHAFDPHRRLRRSRRTWWASRSRSSTRS